MSSPKTTTILTIVALVVTSPRSCDAATDTLNKVIKANEANYAAIRSARGEIEQSIERSPEIEMKLREVLVRQTIIQQTTENLRHDNNPTPDDNLRIDPFKRGAFVSSFVLLGKDIRVNGFTDHPEIVSVAKGDKVANYQPLNNNVQIWNRSTPTDMFRDPRTVFFDDSQQLTETLSHVKTANATSVNSGEVDLLRLTLVARNGNQVTMDCDPAANHLPVFVAEVMPEGTNTTCEIKYQKLESNGENVWFPATLVFKIWQKDTPVTAATENGWNQKTTYTIRNLQINVDVSPEEVSLEVPAGTSVGNAVDKSFYTTTETTTLP